MIGGLIKGIGALGRLAKAGAVGEEMATALKAAEVARGGQAAYQAGRLAGRVGRPVGAVLGNPIGATGVGILSDVWLYNNMMNQPAPTAESILQDRNAVFTGSGYIDPNYFVQAGAALPDAKQIEYEIGKQERNEYLSGVYADVLKQAEANRQFIEEQQMQMMGGSQQYFPSMAQTYSNYQ